MKMNVLAGFLIITLAVLNHSCKRDGGHQRSQSR